MSDIFLTAEWRKLLMANYEFAPQELARFVPRGTELELWNGVCYVSLVGFMFLDTRIKGIPIPFHRNFEEVNLRFYVRRKSDEGIWKRGVVFVKEIVPRRAIALVAKNVYREPYVTLPMSHALEIDAENLRVGYAWRDGGQSYNFSAIADKKTQPIAENSEPEFITEHYWGYTKFSDAVTAEYEVTHPRWLTYNVRQSSIEVNFARLYGAVFGALDEAQPQSVLLAEGSKIAVKRGRKLAFEPAP